MTGTTSATSRRGRLAAAFVVTVAVVALYWALGWAALTTFYISNTVAALADASRGRFWSVWICAALVVAALVATRLPGRVRYLAAGLIAAPAVVVSLLIQLDRTTMLPIGAYLVLVPLSLGGVVLVWLPGTSHRVGWTVAAAAVLPGLALAVLAVALLSAS